MAIIDGGDPAWQVGSFLLGGGAAFLAHAGKAGRTDPGQRQPRAFSNVVVSTGEDVATGGLLGLAIANPIAAALIALILVDPVAVAGRSRRGARSSGWLEPKRRETG